VRIVLHQTWDELKPVAANWNAVLATSRSNTVFLTWEWCEAWWKNYASRRPLFVLSAWERGELVGVAPLYVAKRQHWGMMCSCLRVIGDGSHDSDYLDCFARVGRESSVISAVVKFLEDHRKSWDLIELTGVSQNSPCLTALINCAGERGWRTATEPIGCAVLRLPKRWDEYLQTLQPRLRTKIRSSLDHLQQHLASIPTQCCTPDEVDAWLPELFNLHSRRWEHNQQPGVFRDSAKRAFYHDISHSALRCGWLAFHRLAWSERTLALQYGFRYGNRFYLLQEGYDPDFETLRPGFALRAWLMRHWIEVGLDEYDFLAGIASHKMAWGAQENVNQRLLLAGNGRGEWVALTGPRAAKELKESAARLASPQLLSWGKQFVTRRANERPHASDRSPTRFSSRVVREIASHLYRDTPLGRIGRNIATGYSWNAINRRISRRRAPSFHIFIYHRVNDDRDPFSLDAMPVLQFRQQMEYLTRNFHIISLDQIARGAFSGNGQKHCVAITFDDGYRDNFLFAFPVLKELGIPATIFLATGYIESGELPWYDQVCLAFKLTLQSRISLSVHSEDLSLNTQNARLHALQHTLAVLRAVNENTRLQLLNELFQQLRVPPRLNLPNVMLSWDEVCRMSKYGIGFGAHTVTHPVLAGLSRERLEDEVLGSKKSVENRLQHRVRHFAYPFGKPFDIGPEAKRLVRAAGFETAVTTVPGVNDPAQDPFELKRFGLMEPDLGMFGLKLDWNRMSGSSGTEQIYRQGRTA